MSKRECAVLKAIKSTNIVFEYPRTKCDLSKKKKKKITERKYVQLTQKRISICLFYLTNKTYALNVSVNRTDCQKQCVDV